MLRVFMAPTFTGRAAFDAKGRALVAQLQKAVGDNFHVMFHHWISFDPKQWRSRWREEDLLSGKCKEFWLHEYLPIEVVTKVLSIYPDCGGAYLCDLDGCCIGNDKPVFSDNLDERLTAWSESWDKCFDSTAMKIDKKRLAEQKFDVRGLAMAKELKRAVGVTSRVIYHYTLRRKTEEVLEDGETKEVPRNTNFRRWALKQARLKP